MATSPSSGDCGKLVLIPAAGVAFFDDDSNVVYCDGRWVDYNAPPAPQEAAGRAEGLRLVVGGAGIVIRAGNTRKLQRLHAEWRGMSAYEATYMVWEIWNDATQHSKTVYPMLIPQKVRDGQGLTHRYFKLAYKWVTDNFSKWGELWFRVLSGLERNAMLRGYGPSQLNIKSRPSFSWLFSNPDPGQEDVRIDRFLRGDFRFSDLNHNGTAKYGWIPWAGMEDEDRNEMYDNPDYGDVIL